MKRYGWVMGVTRWSDETGVSHLLVTANDDERGPVKLACGSQVNHGGVEREPRGPCAKCLKALPLYQQIRWGNQ